MKKPLRFAAYMRYSHEEQRGNTSLDTQLRVIQDKVASKGGVIVKIYTDEARSGRTMSRRDELSQMLADAEDRLFDAVIVYQWDRMSRRALDHRTIKTRMRGDLQIEVHSATEVSEHDGGGAFVAEGVSEIMSEAESRRIGARYRAAKMTMFKQGYYVSNHRPFGYDIRKNRDPKTDEQIGYAYLAINEAEAEGVRLAYDTYATGRYSINEVAKLLNKQGYRTTKGRLHSSDGMREILQNPLYIGKLTHREGSPDGSINYNIEPMLQDGVHEPIIDAELWEKVKDIRQSRAIKKRGEDNHNPYLLQGLVWCWQCYRKRKQVENPSPVYAKCQCRVQHNKNYHRLDYVCVAYKTGYQCTQGSVQTHFVDDQIIYVLKSLRIPADLRKRLVAGVALEMRDEQLEARLTQLRTVIENMDYRFDTGLITDRAEFTLKRAALQYEFDKLKPIVNTDALTSAADLIDNFGKHFDACAGDVAAQNRLISRLIQRIYIAGKKVEAIQFKTDIYAVLHYGGEELDFLYDEELLSTGKITSRD
jgi:DNA invertase Pin-like site-specific DNA recombinase